MNRPVNDNQRHPRWVHLEAELHRKRERHRILARNLALAVIVLALIIAGAGALALASTIGAAHTELTDTERTSG